MPQDTLAYREWQVPPVGDAPATESRRLSWLDDAVTEGQAWIRAQRGFTDFRKSLDILSGRDTSAVTADYRSNVSTNRLKRNVREITGTLAKLRPIWGYHSDNKAYADYARMMNQVTRAWYLESFADLGIKEALQYSAATARGWVRPIYRRDMGGTGKGNIRLLTYGAPCVLPFQLPMSGDFQQAYAVSILDELPVYMAHAMFPAYQARLRPSSHKYWYADDGVRTAARGNVLQRAFNMVRRTASTVELTDLNVPVRYTYVIDLSINTTKAQIPMGDPGASWSYTVPFVGQQIPAGRDPHSGSPLYRIADETDSRLYPNRRLLIASSDCIMYDGPSFDWHGMFPGVCFQLDPWPWEPLGFSLIRGGEPLQSAIDRILRGNMDKIGSQLDPALAYDINAVAKKDADRFDPMQPRARCGYDGSAVEGMPFQPAVAPETLKVTPESMAMVEKLEQIMDTQQAIHDVVALAKMRAVGSMDDLEKIMEANGPIIEDMSRSMESPMSELGVMLKYLILQYFPTARVMQYVGADGVARGTFDYDPTQLVPSHLPGEAIDGGAPSSATILQRARTFADNLRFLIMPGTLHEMQQMQMKLLLIQLRKAGVMIDSQTIAEACNISGYGTIDGNTVIERWQHEEEMKLEMAARGKALADTLGLTPQQPPPGAPGPGKPNPEGRPNANTAPPAIQQKDGGSRSTITTSK